MTASNINGKSVALYRNRQVVSIRSRHKGIKRNGDAWSRHLTEKTDTVQLHNCSEFEQRKHKVYEQHKECRPQNRARHALADFCAR